MEPLPLALLGWIFTILSALALALGAFILVVMHRAGEHTRGVLAHTALNDILLFGIWVMGLAGGIGVLRLAPWGRPVLELFCWSLIVLVVLSSATRLYARKQLPPEERGNPIAAVSGLAVIALPLIALAGVAIYTLRSEVAQVAFSR